ncbi:MAG: tRNA dimethylallyltransferase [Lachnospiraceae bacterium]|nr:tRNA dimethylallyltransferase [Lachnospiraceae bacterium]
MKRKLTIISGPTAAGKSRLAVELAKRINGEVVSADSMQVYRHMDIGTAKITKDEMQGVPHHLIDCLEPDRDFNVFKFKELANAALEDIYSRGRHPVIAGGTGFYIQSVLYDIDFSKPLPKGSKEGSAEITESLFDPDGKADLKRLFELSEKGELDLRSALESMAEKKGARFLHSLLAGIDEKSAEIIHENNIKRVIRAIEYYAETGEPISAHNESMRRKPSPYDFRYYCLFRPPAEIYGLIDKRVDKMMEEGLVNEVEKLVSMGLTDKNISMQGLGYRQIYRYLAGDYDLEEAVRLIKRDTRHFAKRQYTWFRRERDVRMLDFNDFGLDYDRAVDFILEDR